jgi:hypothetical protein
MVVNMLVWSERHFFGLARDQVGCCADAPNLLPSHPPPADVKLHTWDKEGLLHSIEAGMEAVAMRQATPSHRPGSCVQAVSASMLHIASLGQELRQTT